MVSKGMPATPTTFHLIFIPSLSNAGIPSLAPTEVSFYFPPFPMKKFIALLHLVHNILNAANP